MRKVLTAGLLAILTTTCCMAQTNDPGITPAAGGYPLFADGKITGAIG